jgi:hypothetical protein
MEPYAIKRGEDGIVVVKYLTRMIYHRSLWMIRDSVSVDGRERHETV